MTDDAAAIKPRQHDVYKGWLSRYRGQTFLTLQPMETIGMLNGDPHQRFFITVKIKLDANRLTATALNADFKHGVKDAAAAKALERHDRRQPRRRQTAGPIDHRGTVDGRADEGPGTAGGCVPGSGGHSHAGTLAGMTRKLLLAFVLVLFNTTPSLAFDWRRGCPAAQGISPTVLAGS